MILDLPGIHKMATTGESVPMDASSTSPDKSRREKGLEDYRKRLIDHKESDDKLRKS